MGSLESFASSPIPRPSSVGGVLPLPPPSVPSNAPSLAGPLRLPQTPFPFLKRGGGEWKAPWDPPPLPPTLSGGPSHSHICALQCLPPKTLRILPLPPYPPSRPPFVFTPLLPPLLSPHPSPFPCPSSAWGPLPLPPPSALSSDHLLSSPFLPSNAPLLPPCPALQPLRFPDTVGPAAPQGLVHLPGARVFFLPLPWVFESLSGCPAQVAKEPFCFKADLIATFASW